MALLRLISIVFANWPLGATFASPLLGVGSLFLQPFEAAGVAGRATPLSATPLLLATHAHFSPSPTSWALEPQLAMYFPSSNPDSEFALGAMLTANLSYRLGRRVVALAGGGVRLSAWFSNGHAIERSGDFVTPAGVVASTLFLLNAGLACWLDEKIRLDVQSSVTRLWNDEARRFRVLLGVSYAI